MGSKDTSALVAKQEPRRGDAFLVATCVLASVPIAKIGDVQALEIVFFAHFIGLCIGFVLRGFRVSVTPLWREVGKRHAIFISLALIMAAVSLRLDFYPPPGVTLLKRPLILSLSRIIEYFLVAFYMLYFAARLSQYPKKRALAMRVYWWTGVSSAVYSIASFPLLYATGVELGAYGWDKRSRGFFNEGGPYGLYLISVFLTGLLLTKACRSGKRELYIGSLFLVPVFVLSQSKAAFVACLMILLAILAVKGTARQKVTLAAGVIAIVSTVVTVDAVRVSFAGYVSSYQNADEAAERDVETNGGFGGRLAGAMIIPRMIAAHPFTGIGFGNYPLMRDDPQYLGGFPAIRRWDLNGLGLFNCFAELGIPLCCVLVATLVFPVCLIRSQNGSMLLSIAAAFQLIAYLFGLQFNFFYPWLCSAFAISVAQLQLREGRTLLDGHLERARVE